MANTPKPVRRRHKRTEARIRQGEPAAILHLTDGMLDLSMTLKLTSQKFQKLTHAWGELIKNG